VAPGETWIRCKHWTSPASPAARWRRTGTVKSWNWTCRCGWAGCGLIPHALAAGVAEGCPGLADAEAVVLDYLRAGNATADGFVTARTECSRRVKVLSERLKALASG
jgi:hypothetical protein